MSTGVVASHAPAEPSGEGNVSRQDPAGQSDAMHKVEPGPEDASYCAGGLPLPDAGIVSAEQARAQTSEPEAVTEEIESGDVTPEPGLSLGARLREARESQQLSADDVAALLKIGSRKIEAIEEGRWDQLPNPPYLRGFLRNYAKILKIDAGALIDEVDRRVIAATTPSDFSLQPSLKTPFPQRSRPHDSGVARFMRIGTLVFAVLAGLIGWSGTESFQHSEERMTSWLAARTKPEAQAETGGDSRSAAGEAATANGSANGSEPRHESDLAKSAADGTSATNTPGTAAAGRALPAGPLAPLTLAAMTTGPASGDSGGAQQTALSGDLVMRFNDESWVEVRQADGKVLMSQLNHAGAGKALDGAPPLELVIGNAPGVALQYRGNAIDLAPYTRDRVAHLTLR